jgi:hypothetical protein
MGPAGTTRAERSAAMLHRFSEAGRRVIGLSSHPGAGLHPVHGDGKQKVDSDTLEEPSQELKLQPTDLGQQDDRQDRHHRKADGEKREIICL